MHAHQSHITDSFKVERVDLRRLHSGIVRLGRFRLADVDAITLSMSKLSSTGAVELNTAARAIVLATMSNTVTKGAIVLMGGSPGLRKAVWPGLVLIFITGVGVAFIL